MTPTTRFVILSEARSGTSLLTDTLNSHPEITCHGEIFHPDPTTHLRGSLGLQPLPDLLTFQQDTARYVEAVLAQPDVKAVGFKMWRSQNEDVCSDLLQDVTWLKIIYERENKLAQYSSRLLAQAMNVWKRPSGEKLARDKVPLLDFREAEFLQFISYQDDLFTFYRSRLQGPSLEITYREIASDGYEQVIGFLGVTPAPLTHRTEQLHTASILHRFNPEDHAAITDLLDRIGKPSWIVE